MNNIQAKEKEAKVYYSSPIGTIEIVGKEGRLTSLTFVRKKKASSGPVPEYLKESIAQLGEYFEGKRRQFSLLLRIQGTDFEKRVWRALLRIPFGKTASYGEVAKAIGHPGAARAVGRANRLNPLAIVIPCHRVIGRDGSLVGYGGGVWRKKWLL